MYLAPQSVLFESLCSRYLRLPTVRLDVLAAFLRLSRYRLRDSEYFKTIFSSFDSIQVVRKRYVFLLLFVYQRLRCPLQPFQFYFWEISFFNDSFVWYITYYSHHILFYRGIPITRRMASPLLMLLSTTPATLRISTTPSMSLASTPRVPLVNLTSFSHSVASSSM
jgi:hypothetical protein